MLYGELPDEPRSGLIVKSKMIGMDKKNTSFNSSGPRSLGGRRHRLCLFKLNMPADGSLAATIIFKCLGVSTDVESGFYMGYNNSDSERLGYIHAGIASPRQNKVQDKTIMLSFPTAKSRLVEFGVYCLDLIEDPKPLALCQILSLVIKPRNQVDSSWTIDDVRVLERGNCSNPDKRLAWKWSGSDKSNPACLPWSKTTGPFSYFDVTVDRKELGRAYCTEFPIHREDFDGCNDKGVEVVIRGRLFGGSGVASLPIQLSKDELGASQQNISI